MSPYMLDATPRPDKPPIYDLYAVVNHYGNVYRGHYAAVVKPPTGMEPGTKSKNVSVSDQSHASFVP